MKWRPPVCLAAMALLFLGAIAWADQIVLKDGTVYSGKFVRGDSDSVDFRILGRTENFRISDIARIVFKEPELDTSAARTIEPAPIRAPEPVAEPEPEPVSPPEPEKRVRLQRPPAVTPRSAPEPAPSEPSVEPDPSPAGGTEASLPVGTPITIRTSTGIDTDRNRVGDVFDATLEQPITWANQTLFPRGTTVKGRIAYAKESGKLSGQSQLILELTELIDNNGKSYLLRTSDYTEVGANRANRTAATVGGTAALGAIIGAIAGGGTGAAVGAASGAAVGTGVQVMTRGEVIRIPAETVLEFRLQSPLKIQTP